LCNTIYKVISKIITERLKKILPKLIHPLQGAFVPGRSIIDNVLFGHEINHSLQSTKCKDGRIAIKLDMEKAYDKIRWDFLHEVLRKYGFCHKFIKWIMECVTSVSYSVLVNGIPTDLIVPEKGIRQGDPLAPYLFILCTEILARKIQFACNEGKYDIGCTITRQGTKIPFLAFADDIIIFTKGKETSCKHIKEILDQYCYFFGQIVNYNKSAIQFSKNMKKNQKQKIRELLQIQGNTNIDKYLGCPMIKGKINKETFSEVICSLRNQLTKWKVNNLSQAGRTTLIKSNLIMKTSYLMQNFLLY